MNLPLLHFADPYVKVWLMFGDKRVEKKKTVIYVMMIYGSMDLWIYDL